MDRLRSPGGCPWDAEQTHESLVTYLLEEAYEAVEAIEAGDRAGMREELGDVLLQVMFHARIAAEDPEDPWTIDEVAAGIAAKLIARHPHVFGDAQHDSAAEVESAWQARKAAEKSRESALDGLPTSLPALLLAEKVTRRAGYAGITVPPAEQRVAAVAAAALDTLSGEAGLDPADFGGLILALVVGGQQRGLEAEAAVRLALRDYTARIRAAEAAAG